MTTKNGTLIERMDRLLTNGYFADVHFLVGKEKEKELLSAHKILLVTASEVFKTMLCSDDAENEKTKNSAKDKK
ncbi:hypothetical protein niasHT_027012 [Heterodera trifolii]|uniref:BTB domain-containing protein n=1 Tax=Heterodera trifolii TaxID=157864 RepID=A0ABD2K0U1_9BILA